MLTLRAKDCLYKAAVSISAESSIIFGFDARFMLDALTQFEKQELVTMRLTSPLGAISLGGGQQLRHRPPGTAQGRTEGSVKEKGF